MVNLNQEHLKRATNNFVDINHHSSHLPVAVNQNNMAFLQVNGKNKLIKEIEET